MGLRKGSGRDGGRGPGSTHAWWKKSPSGPRPGQEDKDSWGASPNFILAVFPGSPEFQAEPLLSSPSPPALSCPSLLSLSVRKHQRKDLIHGDGCCWYRGLLLTKTHSGFAKSPYDQALYCVSEGEKQKFQKERVVVADRRAGRPLTACSLPLDGSGCGEEDSGMWNLAPSLVPCRAAPLDKRLCAEIWRKVTKPDGSSEGDCHSLHGLESNPRL